MGWFLLLFTAVPIIEMYLLIQVGGYLGAPPTILAVMATALIGIALLRTQGLATLQRGVGRLNSGQLPAQEIAEGMMLAVAGALLLTPGFVTDAIGFTLLVPPFRVLMFQLLRSRAQIVGAQQMPPGGRARDSQIDPNRRNAAAPVIIDGEYERRDDDR